MGTEGTLTRPEMDRLKIPRLNDDEPPRDGYALWRQGACLLTKDATLERYRIFHETRRPKTDQEKEIEKQAVLAAKEKKKAQKFIERETAAADTKKRKLDTEIMEKDRKKN